MESLAVRGAREGEVVLEVDPAATRRVYERFPAGGADDCHCLPCGHYGAHRTLGFPRELLDLLARLGVDPLKEAEAVHLGNAVYSVTYPFVGRFTDGPPDRELLLPGPDGGPPPERGPRAVVTGTRMKYPRFGRSPVLQVEIEIRLPKPVPAPARAGAGPDEEE